MRDYPFGESISSEVETATIWIMHNLLHRVDGPAVIWNNGLKEYYIYGIYFSTNAEQWFNALKPEDKERAIWNAEEWKS